MQQVSKQTLQLIDTERRQIGRVTIENRGNHLLTGEFVPSSDFSSVAELFQKFEEAVNVQALSIVDEFDKQLAAFGLQLYSPDQSRSIKIHDVQIWSDGGFSCRLMSDLVRSVNGLAQPRPEGTAGA